VISTTLSVDAVVNAANTTLLGGGGVDGAIHRAAVPLCWKSAAPWADCPVGEAKITKGYNLPARHVIHTVGPVWRGGRAGEPRLLASCYLNSLKLAVEHGVKTLAFPSISTGVYGYPIEEASAIAVQTIAEFLKIRRFHPKGRVDGPLVKKTSGCFKKRWRVLFPLNSCGRLGGNIVYNAVDSRYVFHNLMGHIH